MKYLSPSDLFISILSPESEIFPPTEGLDKHTLEAINFKFPLFPPNELKQIAKEIQTSQNYIEPVTSRYFPVIYQPEIVTILTTKKDILINNYLFISYYILTSYISWELNYNSSNDPLRSLPILESILEICTPKGAVISEKIYNMGITAFYIIFSKLTSQSNFTTLVPFFDPLHIYFLTFPELPQESLNLLSDTLESLLYETKYEVNEDFAPLLNIISKFVYEYQGEIPRKWLAKILHPLECAICQLSRDCLSFFSLIASRVPDDILYRIFTLFPNAIATYINSIQFNFPQPIPNKRTDLPSVMASEAIYRIESKKTFVNGFKFQTPAVFPDKFEMENILTKELLSRMSLIVKACMHSPSIATSFIQNLELIIQSEKSQNFYMGMTSVYLYVCINLLKFVDKQTMFNILISRPYFDPNITVFDNLENFETIDTIRSKIIELAVKEGFDIVNIAIQSWILQPPLLSEIIQRVTRLLTPQMFNSKTIVQFSKTLMNISLFYQQMNFTTDFPFVETARKAIFLMISKLLDNSELLRGFFNCSIFTTFFFSFVFEELPRSFILTYILQYLSFNDVNDVVVSAFAQIFEISCNYIDDVAYQQMISSILQTINESMIHNSSNVSHLSALSTPLLSTLPRITITDYSQQFVLNLIQFLTIIHIKISSPQVLALQNAINRVFPEEFTPSLQQKLIQFISGEPLTSLIPNFIIGQPKILPMFLDLAINKTQNTTKLINLIYDLISASMSNALISHKSGFDMYLLDLISKIAEDSSKIELIQLLMDLFCKIAQESSSVTVVHKFIAFLTPIKGRFLPNNQDLFLKTLNTLITSELKRPNGYLSIITKDDFIEVSGINGEMLEKGFTAGCWIFVDKSVAQYKPSVFSFVDTRDRRLIWFVSAGSLYCTQRTLVHESTGHLELKIPLLQWVYLTVSYLPSNDYSCVTVGINGKEFKKMDFSSMIFERGTIKMTVGGFQNEPFNTQENTKICSFSLHPYLDEHQISLNYNIGFNMNGSLIPETYIAYTLKSAGNKLSAVEKISKCYNSYVNVSCSETLIPQSFGSCLIQYCKPEMLLPLFAQFDMTFTDGSKLQDLPKLVIECVSNCLFISLDAQIDFHNANGFSIISHLLMNLSVEHISYSLYTQFFGMLQSMQSNRMQIDIIEDILLNVPLWMKCEYDQHIKIIRHWGRVLFPSYKSVITEIIPIRRFLSILRIFYWYNPSEEIQNLCKDRFRGKTVDISESRQTILMAMLDLAIDSFDLKDLQCLISHCMTIPEIDQICDLLVFLEELSKKSPQTLKNIEYDHCSFLFQLVLRNNGALMTRVISLLISYSQNNLLDRPLSTIVAILMSKLTPISVGSRLFEYVLTKLKFGIHELLPLVCWMAIILGESQVKRLFTEVPPSQNLTHYFNWSVWPTIACFYFANNSDLINTIFDYMSRCSANQWNAIFCMINIIGLVVGMETSDLKAKFLINVGISMTSDRKISEDDISSFFGISKFFLFYRSITEPNCALCKLFETSVFKDENFANRRKSSFEVFINEIVQMPYLIIDRMNKIVRLPDKYKFGLRLDEDNKWLDSMFAVFCISLFARFNSRAFFDIDLLISSYLLHDNAEVVIEHIKTLSLTKEEENEHLTFISLINHHSKLIGLGEIIDCKDWSEEHAYLCLQRRQFLMDTKIVDMMNFMLSKLQSYYTELSSLLLKIFTFASDEIVQESLTHLDSVYKEEKDRIHRNHHRWSTLWRSLAGDLAPWNCTSIDQIFYKRDQSACYNLCPFKLKRDWNHNPHIDASMARDTGSRLTANEIAEAEKQKRLLEYSANSPIDLLVINNLHGKDNEDIKSEEAQSFPVTIIAPSIEKPAMFKITKDSLLIEYKDGHIKKIPGKDIMHIFFRRRFHHPNSIEIFTIFGKNYFVQFDQHNSLSVISKISYIPMPNIVTLQTKDFYSFFKQNGKTEHWVNKLISTFDYIMHLNQMSGRTFNDLAQYPVFPWLTAMHKTDKIEFKDEFFRDLSKPIGAQSQDRLNDILKRLPDLKYLGENQYMYGSGFSCALTVCLFLIRTEPFTTLHIELQSGKFDHAGRIFSSISTTWKMISTHVNDYREAIPEFFFFPEFLLNLNKFDLGKTNTGPIDNVHLPNWVSNAYDYVYINRKILESDFVSSRIHAWIDLIWGVNSRGENAKLNNNWFKEEMYDSAWDEKSLKNPRRRSEIEATLCHVGQMCPQLFYSPHPIRNLNASTTKFDKKKITITPATNPKIIFARVYLDSGVFNIAMCDSKGQIHSCTIDTEFFSEKTEINFIYKDMKNFDVLKFESQPKSSQISQISDERLIAISNANRKIYIINFKNCTVEEFPEVSVDAVYCMASPSDFCIATASSTVMIFRNDHKIATCMSYREGISCCFSSNVFNVSVIGTRDGFILINSIPTGELVRSINLDEYRPQIISVTSSWGFILVYVTKIVDFSVKHILKLFNINGEFLREREVESQIVILQSFTSRDGFDFICMADEKGRVFIFEAFFLNIGEPVTKYSPQICAMKYFKDMECLCLIGTDGKVSIINSKIPNVLVT